MTEIPPEIIDHYRTIDEDSRIRSGLGQLELLRTQSIVRRFLPPGSQRIVDVGGATGVHASWLAQDGHQVQPGSYPAPTTVSMLRCSVVLSTT